MKYNFFPSVLVLFPILVVCLLVAIGIMGFFNKYKFWTNLVSVVVGGMSGAKTGAIPIKLILNKALPEETDYILVSIYVIAFMVAIRITIEILEYFDKRITDFIPNMGYELYERRNKEEWQKKNLFHVNKHKPYKY